jgi:hypothetical protein
MSIQWTKAGCLDPLNPSPIGKTLTTAPAL